MVHGIMIQGWEMIKENLHLLFQVERKNYLHQCSLNVTLKFTVYIFGENLANSSLRIQWIEA